MSFVTPQYSRRDVNRAGHILSDAASRLADRHWATSVLANWRASHLYPINTFQATLRSRVQYCDTNAIVAQRLKRAPSVIAKLQRFPTMNLAQMQDIGGLRAVLFSIPAVRKLESMYRDPNAFKHVLSASKDYIQNPKPDGYRSVHLVYKYVNDRAQEYDGLSVELQFRTRVQHYWATAVETMGTFLGQALKSGQGDEQWKYFFSLSSAAIAHIEKSPPVPGFESMSPQDTYRAVASAAAELQVLQKLGGFAIAANRISRDPASGKYHLIILETESRSVEIKSYSENRLQEANDDYAEIELRGLMGQQVEAVLVSAGPIKALQKAYPNYFLDTSSFMRHIERVIDLSKRPPVPKFHKKTS